MADTKEGEETAPRNEWEVVSLTASAYAAAPGPMQVESSKDSQDKLGEANEAETSNAMFMSGHFVFPPSQHENLPVGSDYNEMNNEKGTGNDVQQLVGEEEDNLDVKGEENVSTKGLTSDEFPGIQLFDEKGNSLSVSAADFGKDVAFDKEHSIYSTTDFASFHSEATMGKSNIVEEDEGTDDSIEHLNDASDSDLPNFRNPVEGDKYDGADLPCEAWWKRRAVSLYAHAKEANTLWSIVIAAAVMGLVIIGHQWQQERWQVLHHKWQYGLNDEKMGRIIGPLSRFKDVIVGGNRRGSLVRGTTSTER